LRRVQANRGSFPLAKILEKVFIKFALAIGNVNRGARGPLQKILEWIFFPLDLFSIIHYYGAAYAPLRQFTGANLRNRLNVCAKKLQLKKRNKGDVLVAETAYLSARVGCQMTEEGRSRFSQYLRFQDG